jgi:predicted alpha/beta superfamily hydrolase
VTRRPAPRGWRPARAVLLAGLLAACGAGGGGRLAAEGLTLRLTAPPPAVDAPEVHVAGTFNGWNPGDPAFRMERRGAEHVLELPPEVRGPVEFKFTLGSWERVETDPAGGDVPNRAFTVPAAGSATYLASVAAWRDPSLPHPPRASTASPSVTLLDSAFVMPQLGRARRVWIYLPPDYAASDRRYPVLYMHDGQNLFDAATSFAGEWGVDETLDSLHAAGERVPIVVGIDHGSERRFDEYSPWPHPRHGGGEGDAYVAFLVRTLKPAVDARFRTLTGPEHTAVAGSSMGGVISLYAALEHPDVFGHAGVLSPALWATPPFLERVRGRDGSRPRPRLHLVSGGREGETPGLYVRDQERMVEALVAAGFREGADLVARVVEDGTHSEDFWRREFPAVHHWLLDAERGR